MELTYRSTGQFLDDLEDWSKPIKDFRNAVQAHGMEASLVAAVSAMTVDHVSDITLPANPSPEAVMLRHQVLGLSRAASHRSTSILNAVYANFEMGAAAVTVFSNAAWGQIKSSSSLKTEMEKYFGFRIFPHFIFF